MSIIEGFFLLVHLVSGLKFATQKDGHGHGHGHGSSCCDRKRFLE